MDYLEEYGLLGAFDTVCMMFGEKNAIVELPPRREQREECDDQGEDEDSSSDYSEEEGTSYLDLQFYSNAIACQLFHRMGVRPSSGDAVIYVISQEPGSCGAEIAAMLGCMRMGCPFVPAPGPEQDLHRLEHIVSTVAPAAAIVVGYSDEDPVVQALARFGVHRVLLLLPSGALCPEEASESDVRDDLPSLAPVSPDSTCLYVLFTSGSTGVPKGVRGSHAGLICRLRFQREHFPIEEGEVCLRRTPLNFVDSFAEIWSALLSAVPLCAPPCTLIKELGLAGLAPQLSAAGVTRMTLLPSMLAQAFRLSPALDFRLWPSLRVCIVSGEACIASLPIEFAKRYPESSLINLYGSTEVAGDCSWSVLSSQGQVHAKDSLPGLVPIGNALSPGGTRLLLARCTDGQGILDQNLPGRSQRRLELLADGCEGEGELVVCGPLVALGYWGIGEREAEADNGFCSDVTVSWSESWDTGVNKTSSDSILPGRIFLTGDRVRRSQCEFFWLGRLGNGGEAKVRGVRVSLAAAEEAAIAGLALMGVVADIAVVAVQMGEGQEDRLVLFLASCSVVSAVGVWPSGPALRQVLLDAGTPVALLPSLVLVFSGQPGGLPRTSAGKVDRAALRDEAGRLLAAAGVVEKADEAISAVSTRASNMEGEEDKEPVERSSESRTVDLVKTLLPSVLPQISLEQALERRGHPRLQPLEWQDFSFYEMGGDSIAAIEFWWRLGQELGQQVGQGHGRLVSMPKDVSWLRLPLRELIRRVEDLSSLPRQETEQESSSTVVREPQRAKSARLGEYPSPVLGCQPLSPVIPLLPSIVSWVGKGGQGGNSSRPSCSDPPPLSKGRAMQGLWAVSLSRCVDASPLLIKEDWGQGQRGGIWSLYIGDHSGLVVKLGAEQGDLIWATRLHLQESGLHVEAAATLWEVGKLVIVSSYPARDRDGAGAGAVELHGPTSITAQFHHSVNSSSSPGVLWGLELGTGTARWSAPLPGQAKGHAVCTTPAERTAALILAPTHAGVSIHRAIDGSPLTVVAPEQAFFSPPCISNGDTWGVAAASSATGGLICFSLQRKGEELWRWGGRRVDEDQTEADAEEGPPPTFAAPLLLLEDEASALSPQVPHRQRLLLASLDGALRCLDLNDGKGASTLWLHQATRPIFSSPCLINDSASGSQSVVFGSHDGQLRCCRLSDGVLQWSTDCGTVVFASPCPLWGCSFGCVCKSLDLVFTATTGGEVLALCGTCGAVLSRLRLPGEIYSSPVVVAELGCVFVGCRDDCVRAIRFTA